MPNPFPIYRPSPVMHATVLVPFIPCATRLLRDSWCSSCTTYTVSRIAVGSSDLYALRLHRVLMAHARTVLSA